MHKVLARVVFRVFDEVCQHETQGLCSAQQAFVKGRDMLRNTSMLLRNYLAQKEEASPGDDPFLLLSLDCSKGYNNMVQGWINRCLEKSGAPAAVINIVNALLINKPVLLMDGVEHSALDLRSGLTLGCPASCVLYIIAVDPLLSALQRMERLSCVCQALSMIGLWAVMVSLF